MPAPYNHLDPLTQTSHKKNVLSWWSNAYYDGSVIGGHRIMRRNHMADDEEETIARGRNEKEAWRKASRVVERERKRQGYLPGKILTINDPDWEPEKEPTPEESEAVYAGLAAFRWLRDSGIK